MQGVAQTIVRQFDAHFALFKQAANQAQQAFVAANWALLPKLNTERITYYDNRVAQTVAALEASVGEAALAKLDWRSVKADFVLLLQNHYQPELAETFYNSVVCRILHRRYYHNDFIFLRPATSTDYLENAEPATAPSYRAYYPQLDNLAQTIERIVYNFQLPLSFQNLKRDVGFVIKALFETHGEIQAAPNLQIHALSHLFFRNKTAYIIGRVINGEQLFPFAIPIIHSSKNELILDTVLTEIAQIELVFSFTRSYFFAQMPVPSATVRFLQSLMPHKPSWEIYTALGLQKHGKNLFYRDFLHHLSHSSDAFQTAPGIRGMVMTVFALPSYPYVFKLIKDSFAPPKETTRAIVQAKYRLVKHHDRVGRLADTLEFSNVAFPRSRFDENLLAELQANCASNLELTRDEIIIKHLYIERRMTPLNIALQENPEDTPALIADFTQAVIDLLHANIFPGDMLYKNFGVTRHNRVVFYDYDEIEYFTDCSVKRVPPAPNEEAELSGEVWYKATHLDVFPETFAAFLANQPALREAFSRKEPRFFEAAFWQEIHAMVVRGEMADFFAYEPQLRFKNRYSS